MAVCESSWAEVGRRVLLFGRPKVTAQLVTSLQDAGYCVSIARNVWAARAILGTGTVQAVVVSLDCDEAGGMELVNFVGPPRGSEHDIALVALSSCTEPATAALVLRSGAGDYVRAPFAAVEVVARVEALLRWRAASQQAGRASGVGSVPVVRVDLLEQLTPAESSVASRAALGMTNRAIAAELFVSVKAVEFHMSHIFQKLGLSNRTELAALFAPMRAGTAVELSVVSAQN